VFKSTDGVESIMAGCEDGYIRLLDDLDSTMLDDGTIDYECVVQFAPFGLSSGPRTRKVFEKAFLQVIGEYAYTLQATGDLGATDNPVLVTSF
jgi:hypothetical protein